MKNRIQSSGRVSEGVIGLALLAIVSGCTHTTQNRVKARGELEEHSRALTTAVVETLHLQPAERRDEFTGLALTLAKEDQRVEGLPLELVPVQEIVGLGSTNAEVAAVAKERAEAGLERRFARIEMLLGKERRAEERLIAWGAEAEVERNERRARWWKWGGSSVLLIGGLIALCVFFPAAIPLVGRVLGLVVSRVPALAGATGVVSVKAFDAVVRAVERSKEQKPGTVAMGNQSGADGSDWVAELRRNLSIEMDAAHKRLVRQRKDALRLEP